MQLKYLGGVVPPAATVVQPSPVWPVAELVVPSHAQTLSASTMIPTSTDYNNPNTASLNAVTSSSSIINNNNTTDMDTLVLQRQQQQPLLPPTDTAAATIENPSDSSWVSATARGREGEGIRSVNNPLQEQQMNDTIDVRSETSLESLETAYSQHMIKVNEVKDDIQKVSMYIITLVAFINYKYTN